MIAFYHAHYMNEAIRERRRIDVDPLRIVATERTTQATHIRVDGLSESVIVWHEGSVTHDTIVADIAKAQSEARCPVVTLHGQSMEEMADSVDRAMRRSSFTAIK